MRPLSVCQDRVGGRWAALQVHFEDLASSHIELQLELEKERASRVKLEEDFSAKEKSSAQAAEKKLQAAQSKAAGLEKSIGSLAQVVAALTEVADPAAAALPTDVASTLVALMAKDSNFTVVAGDQPPAMQLEAFKVVQEALKKPAGEQCRAVGQGMAAKYGGRWNCVAGPVKYSVYNESGTYLVLNVEGGVQFIIFRGLAS
ncbi:hypothetical protein HYH03_010542 [Edaphochlamys debaryana]|uniref:Dynein light chain n=1 Tax=Edaphochlamys debaryana TaxID=47281 RepID=A0A836BXD2_9CHLO|nr:hypothetical protein HYH03_010542 [Edaphochlamys debaryana]|eukprot:KAG2491098.1 hypothetical protein HYH03_010542 [Edaphochlamys debaryana]